MSEFVIFIIFFFVFLIGWAIFHQYWKEVKNAPTDQEVARELRGIADMLDKEEQEKKEDN